MAFADGRHKLPVKSGLQKAIGEKVGQTVKVVLEERLPG
jgi:hypothetical protein